MKTSRSSLLACLLAIACLNIAARAATLQWSDSLGGPVTQLVSDGRGGCVVAVQVGANFAVIWYDSKGAVRYMKTPISSPPVLIACDKNYVVFCHDEGGFYRIVTVDKEGTESFTSAPGEHYLDYPAVGYGRTVQRRSDSKGYFVERVVGAAVTLQRYSYK